METATGRYGMVLGRRTWVFIGAYMHVMSRNSIDSSSNDPKSTSSIDDLEGANEESIQTTGSNGVEQVRVEQLS